MATTYPGTERHYGPPHPVGGGQIHSIFTGYWFVPSGEAPPGGWPVVIGCNFGGFAGSSLPDTLTTLQGLYYRLVDEKRIALFLVHLPPSRSDLIGGLPPKDQDPEDFDPNAGELGVAYPKGAGAMVQQTGIVGDNWPGGNPSGYVGTHPWQDPDWVMAVKAGWYAIQHMRESATELGINTARLGVDGTSAGAYALGVAALMPDMAGELGMTDSQSMQSTRVAAASLQGVPAAWATFEETGLGSFKAYGFARTDSTPDYDEPGTNMEDVPAFTRFANSLAVMCSDIGPETGLAALNAEVKLRLQYAEESTPAFLAVANRYVYPWPTVLELNTHPACQGYILKALYPHAYLVMATAEAVDPLAASTGGGVAEDVVITNADQLEQDELDWWADAIGVQETIEHRVILATEQVLESVTVANGYLTNVQEVRPGDSVRGEGQDHLRLPAILTSVAETDTDPRFHGTDHNTLQLRLVLCLSGFQNEEGRRNTSRFIGDVRKALKRAFRDRNSSATPYSGLPVTNVRWLTAIRWTDDVAGLQSTGAVLVTEIDYRDSEDDPFAGPPA